MKTNYTFSAQQLQKNPKKQPYYRRPPRVGSNATDTPNALPNGTPYLVAVAPLAVDVTARRRCRRAALVLCV